jgi:hypothetical protein
LWDDIWVIDRRAPILVHAWLGPLHRNGDQELIGSIELDPAIPAAEEQRRPGRRASLGSKRDRARAGT